MANTIKVDFSHCKSHAKTYRWRWRNRRHWLRRLKNANLTRKYGITIEQYEELVKKQDGVCAICGGHQTNRQNKSLDVDHEKGTTFIRGLLCNHCNRGLAFFRHDTKLLSAAIEYMFKHAEDIT